MIYDGHKQIWTSTAEAQNIKRAFLKRLREVRMIINVRMQEALEYKHTKEERVRARLQEVTLQVKTASDK